MKTTAPITEYEKQFAPGCGSAKVRREIDRINRIAANMRKRGVPKADIDYLVKTYERHAVAQHDCIREMSTMTERSEAEHNTLN